MTYLKVVPNWKTQRTNYEYSRNEYTPSVDITEHPEGFRLEFDLPGFTREDLKITVNDKVLTVTGTRERKLEESEDKYFRHYERPCGTFNRSFRLPDYVDDTSVKAAYAQGVLTLELAKKEEAKPHTIEIK